MILHEQIKRGIIIPTINICILYDGKKFFVLSFLEVSQGAGEINFKNCVFFSSSFLPAICPV